MPKKKVNPAEELMEPVEELAEAGAEVPALTEEFLPEEPSKEADAPPVDLLEAEKVPSPFEDAAAFQESNAGEAQKVLDASASEKPVDPEPGCSPPMEAQEPSTVEGIPAYGEPYDGQPAGEDAILPEPPRGKDTPPTPERPMSDRQNFFALDFRELDRGLTAEERQAWNSIYASFSVGLDDFLIPIERILPEPGQSASALVAHVHINHAVALTHLPGGSADQINTAPGSISLQVYAVLDGLGHSFHMCPHVFDAIGVVDCAISLQSAVLAQTVLHHPQRLLIAAIELVKEIP